MGTSRPIRWTGLAGAVVVGAALVVGGTALPAAAKDGDVVKRATCSGTSVTTLKLSAEGRRIETEFEVDSNRNGQRWSVAIYRNGTKSVSTAAVTKAPSGSFSVRALLADSAGRETVKGLASNGATGEVCRVTAVF
jgi:hypothetical protein